MMSKLIDIRDALASIEGLKIYHYWRPRMEAPFCVWQEEGEGDSLHSSNHKQEQALTGSIDYYTLDEFDLMVDAIQDAINKIENLGWMLSSVDYEDETNLIHYSWSWEYA